MLKSLLTIALTALLMGLMSRLICVHYLNRSADEFNLAFNIGIGIVSLHVVLEFYLS